MTIQLHGWILLAWSVGTMLLAAGSAWGAMKIQQRALEKRLDEQQKRIDKDLNAIKLDFQEMEHKLDQTHRDYLLKTDCIAIRKDCKMLRDSQETSTCKRIEEIKDMIQLMDERRETAREETNKSFEKMYTAIGSLSEAVAVLQAKSSS